jgi:hypothetical protein
VTSPPDLSTLNHAEKDTLILALFTQLTAAHDRIAPQDARILALEARLGELTRPPKTPDNSSKPPSQGQKQDRPSPFGHSIAAMVVYLHYTHAIGMERLALLMDELFSLSISEGAISNILARAREPLLSATATIQAVVLASSVVCSDETSARVKGKKGRCGRRLSAHQSASRPDGYLSARLPCCTSSNPAEARRS